MDSRSLGLGRLGRFVACIGLFAVSATAPAAAAMHPNARQGWLIGLGGGGGTSGISVPGASSDRETGFGGSFRVGYAFNPQLSLELNSNAWTKEQSGTRVTFAASGPALNYYPGQQGFVLRAGVGVGSGEASVQAGSATITTSETGLGVLGGLGYEFRVARRFALGPQINASWIDLDSFNANWVNFELGFHWYFLPK